MNHQLSELNSWSRSPLFWTDSKIPGFLKIFPANLKVFFIIFKIILKFFRINICNLEEFYFNKNLPFLQYPENNPPSPPPSTTDFSNLHCRWCWTVPWIGSWKSGVCPFFQVWYHFPGFFIKNHKYRGFFSSKLSFFKVFQVEWEPCRYSNKTTHTLAPLK